jgi:dTMP kinase
MIEGSFIVIEGIDGAGTTTQTARLCEWFTSRGLPVISTREPTPGPIGAMIRQALTHRLVVPGVHGPRAPGWQTMALLFAADRLDHLDAEIIPNVMEGVSVVSDRYDLSSLAYQSATADDSRRDEVVSWIRSLNRHARRPDLTIVLDVPADVAGHRVRKRGAATELYELEELQARLATAYADAEKLVPGDRLVHIDGNRPVDAVFADVSEAVRSFRGDKR